MGRFIGYKSKSKKKLENKTDKAPGIDIYSCALLGCQMLSKTGSGSIFHRFGLDSGSIWGSIWGRRATFLGRTWTSCHRIDMVRAFLQETRVEIHSGFSFSPCSAAVRAQHIRRLPKGCRACRIVIHFILSVPASKLNASELGFRFLPPKPSPILLFLPPDPHIPPHFVRNLLLRP